MELSSEYDTMEPEDISSKMQRKGAEKEFPASTLKE